MKKNYKFWSDRELRQAAKKLGWNVKKAKKKTPKKIKTGTGRVLDL